MLEKEGGSLCAVREGRRKDKMVHSKKQNVSTYSSIAQEENVGGRRKIIVWCDGRKERGIKW